MPDQENIFTQHFLPVMILAPDADRFAGTVNSDVVCLANYGKASCIFQEGAGGTGTTKIQVAACDDFVPTTSAPLIPFKVRVASDSGTLTDQFVDEDDLEDQDATTGYTTVAGANKMVEVIVDSRDLPAGFDKFRLELTEVANDPVDAAVIAILYQPRYTKSTMPTAIA